MSAWWLDFGTSSLQPGYLSLWNELLLNMFEIGIYLKDISQLLFFTQMPAVRAGSGKSPELRTQSLSSCEWQCSKFLSYHLRPLGVCVSRKLDSKWNQDSSQGIWLWHKCPIYHLNLCVRVCQMSGPVMSSHLSQQGPRADLGSPHSCCSSFRGRTRTASTAPLGAIPFLISSWFLALSFTVSIVGDLYFDVPVAVVTE